ncbi:MAG TPA: hypothetical protein VGL51_17890 [Solirubrobacteraceae bacterium]
MPRGDRANTPLRPPAAAAPGTPAWPTFTGTATLVGTSSSGVTVYVDQALGDQGMQNAQSLLSSADTVVAQNNAIFAIAGGPVDVVIYAIGGATDGTGGADHNGCDFTTGNAIEVDASFGSPNRVTALFEAELSECAMNGSLCGFSTGEALSRWCSMVVSSNALSDFATAPAWAQAGMPDWVDQTESTDQDAVSTGCGMAFISWLLSQGHDLNQIATAMVGLGDSGTLAALYAQITGDAATNAWSTFQTAVAALPAGVTTDDPFNGMSQALPAPAAG